MDFETDFSEDDFELDFATACVMFRGYSYDDAVKIAREEIKEMREDA